MSSVNNSIITLHRGDYFEIPIFINLGDRFHIEQYKLAPDDKLYIGIAEPNQPWDFSLIRKVYTYKDFDAYNNVVFKLNPEDTECVVPGKYFLEAKILLENGKQFTVIPRRQFWIVE